MKTLTQQATSKQPSSRVLKTALIASCLSVLLSQPAEASVLTRSSSFVYDPNTGLLSKEIVEPGDPNLCLVTEYLYDDYGNRKSVTTRNCNGSAEEAAAPSGDAVIASRTDTSDYTYNADGTVTVVVKNAIIQSETKIYEPDFGNLVSLTGPNNLPTSWQYDGFGRKHLETRAGNTTTQWDYVIGGAGYAAQPNIAYYVQTTVSGHANKSYDYYDMLGRKVLSRVRNFENTDWIDQGNVVYNARGQIEKSYLPYEANNFATAHYALTGYDLLGRAKSQTTLTENNDWVTSTVTYSGLTTIDMDPVGHTKTTVRDAIGNVATVTDANNKSINYTYDPFGNLVSTTDTLGNVIVLTYDIRGRKTGMDDPDMGAWSYAFNALGELIRQVDGSNQTVTMTYDKLGRIKSRNELDLVSTWTYDTAPYGIGKVASVSSDNGYSRTHSYDNLGRPLSTSTVIDVATAYVTSVGYDVYGRVSTQTYPTGFAVKNEYTVDGYLARVVNAATPATVYWEADSMDAMGHLTGQAYGNGISTTQVFYPQTGRLQRQMAGAGNAVQDTSYTYNNLGNLSQRVDAVNSLTETFLYDTLSRIETATATSGTVTTQNNYTYDAIGNIKTQSKMDGTGAYLYSYSYIYNPSGAGSFQPHAISSITTVAGTVYGVSNPVYTYDGNGNITNGAGRDVAWTSFNMPKDTTGCRGGGATCSTVKFTYNADHERIREEQVDKSVVIVLSPRYDTGLHFEKKYIAANGVLTGAVKYEHYLYAGGIMFGQYATTTTTDGVTIASSETKYYVKDHLGSIVATLNGVGAVTERMSYDVFGKPRYPNGADDPNGLLSNPDMYHGYTGHEMMDAVGFIHMNGRIFDPSVGRFLSADPTIQSPYNMQSYNRYTYGWNDPLNGTDPSGYSWLGERWHALTGTNWNNSRGDVATVVGAVLDGFAYCGGWCSAAAGAYNGYQSGGTRGGVIGAFAGYYGYQMGADMGTSATGAAGATAAGISAEAVVKAAIVNGFFGCASAVAAGGDCARGFLTGAVGTVGSAYGNVGGAALAGCAAGMVGGGDCGEGAVNAVKIWAVMSAAQYAAKSLASEPTNKPDEVCTGKVCNKFACNADDCIDLKLAQQIKTTYVDENMCMVTSSATICVGPLATGPGAEKLAVSIAKQIGRDIGPYARRAFHDAEHLVDRTVSELREHAIEIYEEAGKKVPTWINNLRDH